jgi:hypothetical protein
LYWNARDDTPVAHPEKLVDFTMPYIISGIRTAAQGEWVPPAKSWDEFNRVYYYKRYQTVGGTAQVYSPKLWDTVWRTEWFYEINRPLNQAVNGDPTKINGWTRRDIFGAAVQVSRAICNEQDVRCKPDLFLGKSVKS